VYFACKEVVLATKSSEEEFQNDIDRYGVLMTDYCPVHSVFIPIVVTSASLEVCNYNLEDFENQKVPKDATLRKVDWLIYDFPLPSYLRTSYQVRFEMDTYEIWSNSRFSS
jgi:hypothetical protein